MKKLISLAFVSHTLIGSFCMMPMAMAAEMPTDHDMNVVEEEMTPMIPMSRADCVHCDHHKEKKEPMSQSSCGGQCLSQATSINITNLSFASAQLIATLPVAFSIQWNTTKEQAMPLNINTSPPLTSTDSIVLRL